METDTLIRHLADLEDHFRSMIDPKEPDDIWTSDVEALQEAQDALYDYRLVAEQLSLMTKKYETKHPPERSSGVFVCPECHHRVKEFYTHCSHCGTLIGWELVGLSYRKRGKRP